MDRVLKTRNQNVEKLYLNWGITHCQIWKCRVTVQGILGWSRNSTDDVYKYAVSEFVQLVRPFQL